MDIALIEKMNMKLVKEVEKYPCLYKTDTVEYSRRSITDKAWVEVGRVVGWPGPKCKDKFRNIRSVVSRYKKLMKQGVKKRPYYLMEAMHYTFPYIKSLNENRTNKKTKHLSDKFENVLHYEEHVHEQSSPVDVKNENGDTLSKSPALQLYYGNTSEQEVIEEYSEARSPSPSSSDSVTKNDANHRQTQSNTSTRNGFYQSEQNSNMDTSTLTTDTHELQNDPKKMFLLSLLPDIYEMNDVQTRKFKRGVVQLVDDILSNTYI